MTLQRTKDDDEEEEAVAQRALFSMLEWQLLETFNIWVIFPFL